MLACLTIPCTLCHHSLFPKLGRNAATSKMPSSSPSKPTQWGNDQFILLAEAIASLVMQQRPTIYRTPGLEPWSGNGGSTINQQLQRMLRKLCDSYGAKMPEKARRAGGGSDSAPSTPAKSPRKRAAPSKAPDSPLAGKGKRLRKETPEDETESDDDVVMLDKPVAERVARPSRKAATQKKDYSKLADPFSSSDDEPSVQGKAKSKKVILSDNESSGEEAIKEDSN